MKVRKALRALLKKDEVLITTCAYDALSARIIEQAGIPALITTGFGISASHIGQPDAELYTMTENLNVVKNMVLAVNIPVIADLDTGYGNAINVIRTIKEFERAGCAGGILEDQLAPKRCPACVDAFPLIPVEEAVGKIKAAVDAREDPDFLIVGRTDALGKEAVDRANAYIEAGAEMVLFISKAFPSLRELKKRSKEVKAPFILNFFEGVDYPAWFQEEWKIEDLKEMGVKILDYPFIPMLAAVHAMQAAVTHLARHKSLEGLQIPRLSHEKFADLTGFPRVKALQEKYMPPGGGILGR
ncbi:MAG: isocitrate lyase/PEP mutase family protein [Syntrophales bacterium LBB04]|nr:isocitrate lyase/PEP mutase family protein [Syntrophales bacterium LBB04]